MDCPVCKTTALMMSERQGIEIDYCPQCRGIWLDRGELDKLIDRASPEPPARQVAAPPPPPAAYLMANEEDPSQAYERADSEDNQLELLREGMANLDQRSRDIIARRWLDADAKVTLQELADEYGVSAERIRQIEANALKKMKALFTA